MSDMTTLVLILLVGVLVFVVMRNQTKSPPPPSAPLTAPPPPKKKPDPPPKKPDPPPKKPDPTAPTSGVCKPSKEGMEKQNDLSTRNNTWNDAGADWGNFFTGNFRDIGHRDHEAGAHQGKLDDCNNARTKADCIKGPCTWTVV